MTDNDFTVYDTVRADQLEESGDSIAFLPVGGAVQEVMLTTKVIDSGDSILVTGDSYVSGDRETYILTADHEVDLWTA
jgi:hypothetical protein